MKKEECTFLLKAQILSHSMFTTDLEPPWKKRRIKEKNIIHSYKKHSELNATKKKKNLHPKVLHFWPTIKKNVLNSKILSLIFTSGNSVGWWWFQILSLCVFAIIARRGPGDTICNRKMEQLYRVLDIITTVQDTVKRLLVCSRD